ncbi:50S ribosomal protein L18 [Patescibacteria group bacterium]
MPSKKDIARKRRHAKIAKIAKGSQERPRLVVFRSNLYTYAQLIDDSTGKTIAAASDMKDTKAKGIEKAKNVGLEIAKKAKEAKVETCVFDRNGYMYHGKVKAIAEGAREGGLKF